MEDMQQRLRTVELNLAALEAITDFDKLRILPNDPSDTEGVAAPTLASSHLAIDERVFMQGTRRHLSGDGHAVTIAFIRHIIDEVRAIANTALQHDHARNDSAEERTSLFTESPRRVIHALSCSCSSARKGVERLRQSTYADSQQIGVELADIIRDFDKIIASIATFLARADAP